MLGHKEIRKRYSAFWEKNDHKEIPPYPLVPNDPTTLFTGSGMQQFINNLLGEPHPEGTRVFDIQPCVRSQDIEEVGDNRHTTMFEMMGNWSFGDYFKKEQLAWFFDFLTNTKTGLGLDPNKLYVTVFSGSNADNIELDNESIEIWKKLFQTKDIEATLINLGSEEEGAKSGMQGGRIFAYDAKKNWWSRAGVPQKMPAGEPGGPDSEVFYMFEKVKHDKAYGEYCHPNCDCGRFLEIGNSVFMQFKKTVNGKFEELPKPNVDFGGGLERQLAVVYDSPDVFITDLFQPIIKKIIKLYKSDYISDEIIKMDSYPNPKNIYDSPEKEKKAREETVKAIRIITDHVKAAIMLINEDILPSNKEQGYVVRRMLRRAIWMGKRFLDIKISPFTSELVDPFLEIYQDIYPDFHLNANKIRQVLAEEEIKFSKNLDNAIKEIPKLAIKHFKFRESFKLEANIIDGEFIFSIFESYGFPPQLAIEILQDAGYTTDSNIEDQFNMVQLRHREESRKASVGKFKGGLADNSEQVIKYHTATHLINQALTDILGDDVKQQGSNITGERLRFDFSVSQGPTAKEKDTIQEIVNEKISASLPVIYKMLPKAKAETIGAKSFFKEKYPDTVKVYMIGGIPGREEDTAYSKEFCGGPHVENTKEIGSITIKKIEKIGSNIFRLYAQ